MEEDFKHMVRIARKDVNGNKTIVNALTDIKGVGKALSSAICTTMDFDPNQKIGYLPDEEVLRLEEAVKNPKNDIIPEWMLNRRNDYETGQTTHLIESDLVMCLRDDLNRMKKTRSYKGRRHEVGLPVRGQRTKSTFRKGSSVGVRRRRRG
ncbi:30S ribosomal protein S13 [Methanobacterium sp.]|uniref:30S ribosomal protein S13 n=1 Tax=Methanobacterium sp. TaxID=2164 RepID=UPI001D1CA6C1|nr:30S ribosomal protein S13 [Methanobacterium sp.]MBI4814248.1 30S ribosomal protein S13 [Methanobacterium sp.]MBI5459059.1 30S ribosomal protein S13 [Methanobacterium sp.]MDY9922891.1 30S ribosomal protein S13 [Methanobacterium sp.]